MALTKAWIEAEDRKLVAVVRAQGKGKKSNWTIVSRAVGARTPGACQGRWNLHDPGVDHSPWTPELDARLLELYRNPETDSWSKRARVLAGPGFERRSGADVCKRYFLLMKNNKNGPSAKPEKEKGTSISRAARKGEGSGQPCDEPEGVALARRSAKRKASNPGMDGATISNKDGDAIGKPTKRTTRSSSRR